MFRNQQETIQTILANHTRRYPRMQVQDLYKLLHQAALGSEHAVGDEASARRWLERELGEMGNGPDEPPVDPISPSGIVRIHLRPYIQNQGDPSLLLDAFIQTANHYVASPERLPVYGQLAVDLAKAGQLPFAPAGIELFWAEMAGQGFPAVHHSNEFVAAYRPAYRVILRELLRDDR